MSAARIPHGPDFINYFSPIIAALKQLGGSGRPNEVFDVIVQVLHIPPAKLADTTKTGAPRIKNRVHWARFYLARAGYIDSSSRGVWRLTKAGLDAKPWSKEEALALFLEIDQQFRSQGSGSDTEEPSEQTPPDGTGDGKTDDYRTELLEVLRALSPAGFERISQRLLRESGFERVTITGRTGDGGIDGIGVVQVTPFVSFKALFQCKRYAGSVGASQVRDFRGAMAGRADKGIILTTGTFTKDARDEAVREGVPPIELVDGEKLVDLFESLELGLKPRKAYSVDHDFFREYK